MNFQQMITTIDTEADIIRTKVVGDPVRAFEYQWTDSEAKAFKAANYTGDVPFAVASWATAKEWTPQQACDDILVASNQFWVAMKALRTIRLYGKERIRAAEAVNDMALAESIYQSTMQNFSGLRQQLGI